MMKYIFKIIISIIVVSSLYMYHAFADAPNIIQTSIGENGIHPSVDFNFKIDYNNNSGINISSANLKLHKFDGTNWGVDIAGTYVDSVNKIVNQNSATYPILKLNSGKYKFVFSISDNSSNSSSKEVVFFIDAPQMIIEKSEIDIGNLAINTEKLSNISQKVTVKTIGTPYTIRIKNPEGLTNDIYQITPYNGTNGWGYKKDTGVFKKIDNPEILANTTFRESFTGAQFTDTYLFKFGAKNTNSLQAAGVYSGTVNFDINLKYCPKYKSDGVTCEENNIINIKETASVKSWSNGSYAKTCNHYKNPNTPYHYYSGDIGDGDYMIQPDSSKPAFKVYCDMTTNGGGWTQYVNIKGSYSFADAKSCWLGTNISNSTLECFNPNRYNIDVESLYNDDWGGTKYFYNLVNLGASTSVQTPSGNYRCVGHNEFMTVMASNNYPNNTLSNVNRVRFGKSYCGFGREPAGISSTVYMNYDPESTFGTSAGANRENQAKNHKLYFRDKIVINYINIVNYNSGRRWSDGTYAKSCGEYKNPTNSLYVYEGAIGNGNYYIDPDGVGGNPPILTNCTMYTDFDIVNYNSGKRWSDGSYAKSCNEYKNPPSGYIYAGATGDGNYYIDNDGSGPNAPYIVECNMSLDSGGWTKIQDYKTGVGSTYISGNFSGGTNVLMTYKRQDNSTNKYAIKITQFRTKQCGQEYTTIPQYINHILTGSWGACPRNSTSGDYNDIKTEKIVEGDYINDACVTGTLHKTDARNTYWGNSGGRGYLQFRVSNITVLMGNTGQGSVRCAGSVQSNKKQTEVTTWVR